MTGKLYGVGVGPGDPELITLKAKRILTQEADVIAIPVTDGEKESLALTIVGGAMELTAERMMLQFPMSRDRQVLEENWEQAALKIREQLDKGRNVAFITLGDPSIYSTFRYIQKKVAKDGYAIEIVPGVPSFCAAAAKAGVSLGEERETIAIVPSPNDCSDIDNIVNDFDTTILMKVSKTLPKIKALLESHGLLDHSVLVSRCGMKDESIDFDWHSKAPQDISYFSTMIIRKGGV